MSIDKVVCRRVDEAGMEYSEEGLEMGRLRLGSRISSPMMEARSSRSAVANGAEGGEETQVVGNQVRRRRDGGRFVVVVKSEDG